MCCQLPQGGRPMGTPRYCLHSHPPFSTSRCLSTVAVGTFRRKGWVRIQFSLDFYQYICLVNSNSGLNTEIQSVQSILIQPKYNNTGRNGNNCFTYQVALHSHSVSACCWFFWVLDQIFSCEIFYSKLLMFLFSCHLLLAFWEPHTLALVNLLSKTSLYFQNKIRIYKKIKSNYCWQCTSKSAPKMEESFSLQIQKDK